MTGSAGPPAQPPRSPRRSDPAPARQVLRVVKWAAIVGLALVLVAVAGFVYLYKTTDIPDPNKGLPDPDLVCLLLRRQDRGGQLHEAEPRVDPAQGDAGEPQDAVVAAENRTFWSDRASPQGIIRAAFSNASGNPTQGADDHPAVREDPLPQPGALLPAQDHSDPVAEDAAAEEQVRDPRGLPQHHLLRPGAYGVQAAAKAYFDKDAADLSLKESAVLASVLNNPHFDPANGKQSRQDLHERYDYVLSQDGVGGQHHRRGGRPGVKHLPKFPEIKAESRYGGQRNHMLTLVRNRLHELGYSDQQIDGEGLRVTTTFTKKAMDAAAAGSRRSRPDMGKANKDLHVAVASVEPGTGALRGFLRRPGLPGVPDQLGGHRGAVGSTFKPFAVGPRWSRASRSGHLRRQLAVPLPRRGHR